MRILRGNRRLSSGPRESRLKGACSGLTLRDDRCQPGAHDVADFADGDGVFSVFFPFERIRIAVNVRVPTGRRIGIDVDAY